VLEHEGRTLSAEQLADYWVELAGRFPIISIEDGMDEEDWDGWSALTRRMGRSAP
jgi:enolase